MNPKCDTLFRMNVVDEQRNTKDWMQPATKNQNLLIYESRSGLSIYLSIYPSINLSTNTQIDR